MRPKTISERVGDIEVLTRAYCNLSWVLDQAGRSARRWTRPAKACKQWLSWACLHGRGSAGQQRRIPVSAAGGMARGEIAGDGRADQAFDGPLPCAVAHHAGGGRGLTGRRRRSRAAPFAGAPTPTEPDRATVPRTVVRRFCGSACCGATTRPARGGRSDKDSRRSRTASITRRCCDSCGSASAVWLTCRVRRGDARVGPPHRGAESAGQGGCRRGEDPEPVASHSRRHPPWRRPSPPRCNGFGKIPTLAHGNARRLPGTHLVSRSRARMRGGGSPRR